MSSLILNKSFLLLLGWPKLGQAQADSLSFHNSGLIEGIR